jgi:hypothetical protein
MEHPSEEGSIDSEKKNVLPKLSYFLKVTQLASGSTGTCWIYYNCLSTSNREPSLDKYKLIFLP